MINDQTKNKPPFEAESVVFKALNHPVRLAILEVLRDGEHCVCHLSAYLGQRQSYISQQLIVLRESGLVQDRRDGWNVYYSVVNPLVFEIVDGVRALSGAEASTLPIAQTECTCPSCSSKKSN
ncbi:MAG: metalloregulator ArsR/SmtB family transcription factor [Anaerolineaceae bacterium]